MNGKWPVHCSFLIIGVNLLFLLSLNLGEQKILTHIPHQITVFLCFFALAS